MHIMDHNNNKLLASIAAAGKPKTKKRKNGNRSDTPLRQGKWTREEEDYVHCLIDEFKTGMMPLAEGTSLRTFLSKMLNCHPMRISKKFVGSNYAGKSVYTRLPESQRLSNEDVQARRAKLCDLERKFLAKIQGKAGASSTPSASIMETVAPNIARGVPSSNTALSFPTLAGAGGINRGAARDLGLRNLINQATTTNPQQGQAAGAEVPLNISLLGTADSSSCGMGSSQSLLGMLDDFVNSSSSGNMLGGSSRGLNASSSLEAFQSLLQQQHQQQPNSFLSGTTQHTQQHHHHKANARAAAAGRALLESGGGLGLGSVLGGGTDHATASMMKPPSMTGTPNKPLAEFTSAELAAELQKRTPLTDLMASFGNGTGGAHSISQNSLATLQDSLHQTQSANAFSTLMRNSSLSSSIDMSNLIERKGSIDSLSNLAIRSHLQSMQSMGSLLDPILEGGGRVGGNSGHSHNNNSTWTPSGNASLGQGPSGLGMSSAAALNMNNFFAANAGNMFGGNGHTNNLMQSLGNPEQLRNAINSSGLDLASLLNNEDALRRLEAMPSSLNHNFSFHAQDSNTSQSASQRRGGPGNDPPSYSTAAASADQNTAIAQFLLQKKLMEQQQSGGGNGGNRLGGGSSNIFGGISGNNDEQELMRNMAAAPGVSGSSNAGGSASMNPMMSSLLSTLQSRGGTGASAERRTSQQGSESHGLAHGGSNDPATMDALKRKFLSGRASQEELVTAMEEHRRNKPFR